MVVSLSNTQLLSLDDSVKAIFGEPVHIEPFTAEQIQALCDTRIRRMAREKWSINPVLLEAIRSRTGGNARSVITILRDLIDEKRGLGCEGTLEGLTNWNVSGGKTPILPELEIEESLDKPSDEQSPGPYIPSMEKQEESRTGELGDLEPESENPLGEEDWDQEPDDMWEENEAPTFEEQDAIKEPIDPGRITDWTAEQGTMLTIEEGTEPPLIH